MQIQSLLPSYSYYNRSMADKQMALLRIATGQKNNTAADDAASLAISERFKSQTAGLNQASRNMSDSVSLLNTSEGAMSSSTDVIQRMRELSLQASNGILTDEDRNIIQQEMNQLQDQLNTNANYTQFNGIYTNNGTLNNFVTQAGANSGQTMSTSIDNTASSALGVNNNVSAQSTASNNLGSIDTALQKLSSSRAEVGAVTNRLEYGIGNANQMSANDLSAYSGYRDADVSHEVSLFNQSGIKAYASIMALAGGLQGQQNILSLLV